MPVEMKKKTLEALNRMRPAYFKDGAFFRRYPGILIIACHLYENGGYLDIKNLAKGLDENDPEAIKEYKKLRTELGL